MAGIPGVGRRQRPGGPHHYRSVLRPDGQRRPARPHHRPGAGRAGGHAVVRQRARHGRRSTSAISVLLPQQLPGDPAGGRLARPGPGARPDGLRLPAALDGRARRRPRAPRLRRRPSSRPRRWPSRWARSCWTPRWRSRSRLALGSRAAADRGPAGWLSGSTSLPTTPTSAGGSRCSCAHAAALVELGRPVTVVAPDSPTDVLDAAASTGADVVAIRAGGRRDYLRRLARVGPGRAPRTAVVLRPGPRAGDRRRTATGWSTCTSCRARLPSRPPWLPHASAVDSHPHALRLPHLPRARGADVRQLDRSGRPARATGGPGRRSASWGGSATDKGADLVAQALDKGSARRPRGRRRRPLGARRPAGARSSRHWTAWVAASPGSGTCRRRTSSPRSTSPCSRAGWPESFGLVVAEAMGAGVPFVVSDAGALPEVAGPGHPWVARSGDLHDLAAVLHSALAASPDEVRDRDGSRAPALGGGVLAAGRSRAGAAPPR